MKSTAIHVAVMLTLGAVLLVGCVCNTKKTEPATPEGKLIRLEDSLNEKEIATLPALDHKDPASKKTVKIKPAKPFINTSKIVRDCDNCGCEASPPVQEDAESIIIDKVEMEAEYPGGAAAWQRFLNRNLRVPDSVIDNELQGNMVVQFVVDEEGNVSNVEAVSGQGALCAALIRVIQKSGKWAPAMRNGHHVKSLKKQPLAICFREEE